MASPYTKDLALEVAYKLQSIDVYEVSTIEKEWFSLVDEEFWLSKFIRNFGSKLENGADYETEYLTIETLDPHLLGYYVIKKEYTNLLIYILDRWNISKSLIIMASASGKLDIMKILISYGANIHKQDDWALCISAQYGHLEVVKFLLANGADIHTQEDYALRGAVYANKLDVVKFLVANGASIHIWNDFIFNHLTKNAEMLEFLSSIPT